MEVTNDQLENRRLKEEILLLRSEIKYKDGTIKKLNNELIEIKQKQLSNKRNTINKGVRPAGECANHQHSREFTTLTFSGPVLSLDYEYPW